MAQVPEIYLGTQSTVFRIVLLASMKAAQLQGAHLEFRVVTEETGHEIQHDWPGLPGVLDRAVFHHCRSVSPIKVHSANQL